VADEADPADVGGRDVHVGHPGDRDYDAAALLGRVVGLESPPRGAAEPPAGAAAPAAEASAVEAPPVETPAVETPAVEASTHAGDASRSSAPKWSVGSTFSARLISRYGLRPVVTVAMLVATAGMLCEASAVLGGSPEDS